MRKVEEALASGDKAAAKGALAAAEPILMRTAQKGIIHKKLGLAQSFAPRGARQGAWPERGSRTHFCARADNGPSVAQMSQDEPAAERARWP